jgi:hypothetical protein
MLDFETLIVMISFYPSIYYNILMDEDERIIDLDLEHPKVPNFLQNLNKPINLTLCAGDGNRDNITDIEWYVTERKGDNIRESNYPTTIFMTCKNYAPYGLKLNKIYLRNNTELKVILLVYDYEKLKWKENLIKLFTNSIDNIHEDRNCYGDKLDLKTLYEILKHNGTYYMNIYRPSMNKFFINLYDYKNYFQYFTINFEHNIATITKNNGNILNLPHEWGDITDPYIPKSDTTTNRILQLDGLKRFYLDKADDEKRTAMKKKITNCESDEDCKFFGKNGTCESDKICYFEETKGGKGIKSKKKRKSINKKKSKNNRIRKTRKNTFIEKNKKGVDTQRCK